ncbi:unnamed protein product, partial [Polarella glacialis]
MAAMKYEEPKRAAAAGPRPSERRWIFAVAAALAGHFAGSSHCPHAWLVAGQSAPHMPQGPASPGGRRGLPCRANRLDFKSKRLRPSAPKGAKPEKPPGPRGTGGAGPGDRRGAAPAAAEEDDGELKPRTWKEIRNQAGFKHADSKWQTFVPQARTVQAPRRVQGRLANSFTLDEILTEVLAPENPDLSGWPPINLATAWHRLAKYNRDAKRAGYSEIGDPRRISRE